MNALVLEAVSKRFGQVQALHHVSLAVAPGEFLCILGPTNAGKSTLLKTIAGLHRPDQGRIFMHGREVTDAQPAKRNLSLSFQSVALFPDRSGFDNLAFPLRQAGTADAEVAQRVHEVAELLRITHVLTRFPRTYSGGERQRVAIGRAIIHPVNFLMLDEPLSNLDARIRIELRIEFRRLHRTLGRTVIYVTHDQSEALSLADRVAVLHRGIVQQVDQPDRLYEKPANRFVAEFIGSPPMNLIPAWLHRGRLVGSGFEVDAPEGLSAAPQGFCIGVRPEAVRLAAEHSSATPFAARVRWIEHHGSRLVIDASLGGTSVKAVACPDLSFQVGGPVWLGFAAQREDLLDVGRDVFL